MSRQLSDWPKTRRTERVAARSLRWWWRRTKRTESAEPPLGKRGGSSTIRSQYRFLNIFCSAIAAVRIPIPSDRRMWRADRFGLLERIRVATTVRIVRIVQIAQIIFGFIVRTPEFISLETRGCHVGACRALRDTAIGTLECDESSPVRGGGAIKRDFYAGHWQVRL